MTEAGGSDPLAVRAGALRGGIDHPPARRGVLTLRDREGRVVTVVATGNARDYIERKLGAAADGRPSDLAGVTATIGFAPAASMLEAELMFLAEAQRHAPATYAACVERSAGWFLQAEPGAEFPRFTKVSTAMLAHADPPVDAGMLIGPARDKHAAGKLIEGLQDAFDLCRYHHILVQAPRAAACVYKELGKCPAPCDGSEPMESYRSRFADAVSFGVGSAAWAARAAGRMRDAAALLDFERAASLRRRIDAAGGLLTGGARLAGARWQDGWVAFSPGLERGVVRIMALGPYPARTIADLACGMPEAEAAREVEGLLSALPADRAPRDAAGWHALGLICDWMYRPASKRANVRIVPAGAIAAWEPDASSAWREAARRAAGEPDAEADSGAEALRLDPIGGVVETPTTKERA